MTLKMPWWFPYVFIAVIILIVTVLGLYYGLSAQKPSPNAATWIAAQKEADVAAAATPRAQTNAGGIAQTNAVVAQTNAAIGAAVADTEDTPDDDDAVHFMTPSFGVPLF
jgi:hypothetical protein